MIEENAYDLLPNYLISLLLLSTIESTADPPDATNQSILEY
jgi:hypothetical protein